MTIEISEVDSEYILEHFKELTDGPFADLSAALRELNTLPEVLAPAQPPLLPSQVMKNVKPFKRSTGRNATTIIIATALAASTTLGAAALTGVGPKPFVQFAKSTIKKIESVGSSVINLVAAPKAPDSQSEVVPTPTATAIESLQPTAQPSAEVATKPDSAPVEKKNTSEVKALPSEYTGVKAEEQKAEKTTAPLVHPTPVKSISESEQSTHASEKTEVKTTGAAETKAPEKQETKAPVPAESKSTQKSESKPAVTSKPKVQSTESKGSSESKDD